MSLERLAITRVVIAHRLSTVRRADRIIMLMGGKLVQMGSFDELVARPGPFADFAQRQLLQSAIR
jgi:ABC-type multidrug transport system fused ATPase/permease subunit